MEQVQQLVPMRLLKQMKHRYPGLFDYADQIRGDRKYDSLWDHSRSWTTAGVILRYLCSTFQCSAGNLPMEQLRDMPILQALAGWRQGKNIYHFDKDLTDELYRQAGKKQTISKDMLRLPCYALYIRPDGKDKYGEDGQDFFACWNQGDTQDLYLFTIEKGKLGQIYALTIRDEDQSLEDCIRRTAAIQYERARSLQGTDIGDAFGDIGKETAREAMEAARETISRWVSLLLYLTAVNADIRDDETHYHRTSRKVADIPREVRYLRVGEETGMRLRLFREETGRRVGEERGGHHKSPAMHLRRAHWHTYRTGSRKLEKEKRQTILKWIAPVIVNQNGEERDLVTIEQVRGKRKKAR